MSITAIINAYRRPHTIFEQIQSLRDQTIPPDEIWLWRNYHPDFNIDIKTLPVDKYCDSNYNWKYFGRFSFGMLAKTDFIAFFDDDTIPGKNWFENCIETYKKSPGILGGVGLYQHNENNYMDHTRFGWPSANPEIVQVDLVGHAWFIPKQCLGAVWIEEPVTYNTAEDMHLSYICQKYGGIKTFVPPHPIDDKDMWSSLKGYELGIDSTTDSVINRADFFAERNYCLQNYVNRGWKLLCSE